MNSPTESGIVGPTDVGTVRLSDQEQQRGGPARHTAFVALAILATASIPLAGYVWYLWCVTARTSFHTFLVRDQLPLILTSGEIRTVTDYFVSLDISTFSALILALFSTRLASCGISNTLWRRWRDGGAYKQNAYEVELFPESFELVCIRFGLLGTLLSFLLAAISQIGDQSNTEDLSGKIFLLLCASLVSTFVGTFLAYAVMPPLNWLNGWAVGLHQQTLLDEELVIGQFIRELDQTTARLREFQATTQVLSEAADGVRQFQKSAAAASGDFARIADVVNQSVEAVQTSNKRAEHLVTALSASDRKSQLLTHHLERFASDLQAPLDHMSKAAGRLDQASVDGRLAFQDLRELATTVEKPLALLAHFSRDMWKILTEVRDSLKPLAESEKRQIEAVLLMTQGLTKVTGALTEVSDGVSVLCERDRLQREDQDEAQNAVVAMRSALRDATTQLLDLQESVTELGQEAHSVRRGKRADGQSMRVRHDGRRSWWQRVFG